MPEFNLTVIPFLLEDNWNPDDDTVFISIADSMAADPQGYWRLHHTADLLPIGAMRVTAHPPVVTDGGDAETHYLLGETGLIRTLEGGSGHWMGMGRLFGWSAWLGGWVSYSSANPATIAHELGHNFNLLHTPGTGSHEDPMYPHPYSSIGTWGYSFRDMFQHCGVECLDHPAGQHVDPETKDLMSYSSPKWISDYHFAKALEYRLGERRAGCVVPSRQPCPCPDPGGMGWRRLHGRSFPWSPLLSLTHRHCFPSAAVLGLLKAGPMMVPNSSRFPSPCPQSPTPESGLVGSPSRFRSSKGGRLWPGSRCRGPAGPLPWTPPPIDPFPSGETGTARSGPSYAGHRSRRMVFARADLAGVDLELEVLMSRGIPYPAAWW